MGRVPPRSIASLPPVRVSFTGHGTRRASAEKNLIRSAGTSARIRVPRECGGGQELARPLDEPPEDVPIEAYARSARYTPRRAGPPRPGRTDGREPVRHQAGDDIREPILRAAAPPLARYHEPGDSVE